MQAILKYSLYRRPLPTNQAAAAGYLPKDSVIDVVNIVSGSVIDGISTWYKAADGFFYWGGGIDPDTLAGPDIAGKTDWYFNDFSIPGLWKSSKGENITVAILDSGLNYKLQDFTQKQNIRYFNAVTKIEDREDCMDDSAGHGTDCAGILCAQGAGIWGVAPSVSLIVVRITNASGSRSSEAILNGIDYAIKNNTDVISLSFQMAQDAFFDQIHEKITEAFNAGIIIIASVGNSGALPGPVNKFPASFKECFSVGAVNKGRHRTASSSKSDFLALTAPGENLKSVRNLQNLITGTSFSAPFVAGIAAIIKSTLKKKGKTITGKQLTDGLKETADKDFPGYNSLEYGAGIIDPLKCLNYFLNL